MPLLVAAQKLALYVVLGANGKLNCVPSPDASPENLRYPLPNLALPAVLSHEGPAVGVPLALHPFMFCSNDGLLMRLSPLVKVFVLKIDVPAVFWI